MPSMVWQLSQFCKPRRRAASLAFRIAGLRDLLMNDAVEFQLHVKVIMAGEDRGGEDSVYGPRRYITKWSD